ncbi:MAG: hypothetical protein DBX38_08060 [Eubacteriales Family XIII. Incertae Sedis bacterium]|nr:MAG: hypothetical protein DBX38_08060 [Clostridiales Family XIII bacterium]
MAGANVIVGRERAFLRKRSGSRSYETVVLLNNTAKQKLCRGVTRERNFVKIIFKCFGKKHSKGK